MVRVALAALFAHKIAAIGLHGSAVPHESPEDVRRLRLAEHGDNTGRPQRRVHHDWIDDGRFTPWERWGGKTSAADAESASSTEDIWRELRRAGDRWHEWRERITKKASDADDLNSTSPTTESVEPPAPQGASANETQPAAPMPRGLDPVPKHLQAVNSREANRVHDFDLAKAREEIRVALQLPETAVKDEPEET